MRAVPFDLDEADEQQQHSLAAGTVPAAAAARSDLRGRRAAAALWHAIPLLVRVMFALDLLMGVLYIVSRRVRNSISKPLLNFFDLNAEANLPSWYSAGQLALIGGLLVVFAAAQLRRGARAAWAVMLAGVAFCFLSLDETTSLHENFGYWLDHVRHRRDTVFAETGFWMLICGPAFLGALVLVGLAARRYLRGRRGVVTKLAIGAALFVAAGAGVEALSNFATPQGTAARLLILAEEMGEMLGATTMLWGVCELMRSHGLRLLVSDHGDADDAPATARSSV